MKTRKSEWPKELRPVVEQSATSARDHIIAAFHRWKTEFLYTATTEYDIEAETASEIANVLEWNTRQGRMETRDRFRRNLIRRRSMKNYVSSTDG